MVPQKHFKICRRVGDRIFPQCQTPRYSASLAKRGVAKKGRGGGFGGKSDFGAQLTEKQKVRFAYGVTERQFSNYVKAAREKKEGSPATTLYQMLETRLDNVVYRLGFAASRRGARQMVSHGHITVNGRRVTIPSMTVGREDKISVRGGSRTSSLFANMNEKLKEYHSPSWLLLKGDTLEGEVVADPAVADAAGMNLAAILEFYSR